MVRTIIVALLGAASAFGSLNNCPSGVSNVAVSNGSTSPTSPIAPAGPGNDFATLAAGCQAVDLSFTNFTGTFAGTGTANNVLTLGGTYFTLSDATDVLLSTVRGTATVSTDGDNNDGTNNWIANSSDPRKDVADDLAFVVTASTLSISQVSVTVNGLNLASQGGSTGSGTIIVNFCLGGTATGIITSAANCTGGGTFQSQTITLVNGLGTTPISLLFATNRVALTTIVNLNGSGNATAGFASIGLGFTEIAPEPSTFVMMGSMLAGAALLRFRRRT